MNAEVCDLTAKQCTSCEGGVMPMTDSEVETLLSKLDEWELVGSEIGKTFQFKNHYQTMAFVNAIAWISHRENHHPGLEVSYNTCRVRYSTHAIGGLSENDFICAAKINLLQSSPD